MYRSQRVSVRPGSGNLNTPLSPKVLWPIAIVAVGSIVLAVSLGIIGGNRPLLLGMIVIGIAVSALFIALFATCNSIQLLSIWVFLIPFSIRAPSESLPITATYVLLYLIMIRHIIVYPRLRIPDSIALRVQLGMVLTLFALGVVTAVTGIDPANSIRKLYNTFNFVLVFVATIQIVRNRDDVRLILQAMIVSGTLLATTGLIQVGGAFLLGGGLTGANPIAEANQLILTFTEGNSVVNRVPDWSQWWRYNNWYSTAFGSLRATGTTWSPMSYAQMLYISYFPLMALTLAWPKRRGRALLFLLLMLQSAALIATLSRGAWLGMVVGIAIIGLYFLRGRIRVTKTAMQRLVVTGLAAALLFVLIAPREQLGSVVAAIQSAFQPEVGVSQFDSSNLARFGTYQTGIEIFVANPVTGVGPGNYSLVFGSGEGATSHNLYLNLAAEMGIFGLLLFVGILTTTISNLSVASRKSQDWHIKTLSVGWIATLVALMFYWMFTSYFFEPKLNMMVWFVLGLSVSLRQIAKAEHRGKERAT